ncbi:hypothetical protein JCM10207_005812 [Rhodosporidiobolus poonsookiae]
MPVAVPNSPETTTPPLTSKGSLADEGRIAPPPSTPPYFAFVAICKRLPHLTKQEYVDHYRKASRIHFPLATAMPGLVKYLQLSTCHTFHLANHVTPGLYDSVSLYVYRDEETFLSALESPMGMALEADSPTFMDMGKNVIIPVTYQREFFDHLAAERMWSAE